MTDHSKRSEIAYLRATQLLRSDPLALTAHHAQCRFVSGLESVAVSTPLLKLWRVRPCARCVPYSLLPAPRMSAMAWMSKAIRKTIEKHSSDGTLKGLPGETLLELHEIVDAYAHDLATEVSRRQRGEA